MSNLYNSFNQYNVLNISFTSGSLQTSAAQIRAVACQRRLPLKIRMFAVQTVAGTILSLNCFQLVLGRLLTAMAPDDASRKSEASFLVHNCKTERKRKNRPTKEPVPLYPRLPLRQTQINYFSITVVLTPVTLISTRRSTPRHLIRAFLSLMPSQLVPETGLDSP